MFVCAETEETAGSRYVAEVDRSRVPKAVLNAAAIL